MELKEQFEQAVDNSKLLQEKPDNDVLLQLYSLYKQATAGNAPEEGGYNMFDFVGKAKHEAWKKLRNVTEEQAMRQYVDLVQTLR